jgi:hypothetical protein
MKDMKKEWYDTRRSAGLLLRNERQDGSQSPKFSVEDQQDFHGVLSSF